MTVVTGREPSIEVNGKAYRLGRLERRQGCKFAEWATTKLPDPIKAIASQLKDLPPEAAAILCKEAVAQAGRPRDWSEQAVQNLFMTDPGLTEMGAILLRECQPDLLEAEARKIIAEYIAANDVDALLEKMIEAQGKKD